MPRMKVSYREVAKMMVRALPIDDDDIRDKVEDYLETIKAMPTEAKVALKSAYIFSRKVPRQEREDLFQDLALAVFKAKTKDERLAYTIARCDWRNWWAKYSIRQHYSLDTVVEDDEGNPATLAELIVGEVEFEFKMDGKIEADRIWNKLPDQIKPLVQKRLLGFGLPPKEGMILHRWVKSHGYALLLA